MKTLLLTLFMSGFLLANSQISLDNTTVTTREVTTDLDTPWEILWGPDDMIWMTERRGIVSRVHPETGTVDEVLDITSEVTEESESGLLGMALHPNFMSTGSKFVYLVYTYEESNNKIERLSRFTYNGSKLVNEEILLDDVPAARNHSGSRLYITPDEKILMSTGDALNTSLSQNENSLAGKFLRLNLDGSIPTDNPNPTSEIWSIGHRNPQGIVMANGMVYSSEHGPNSDDEINIITKGGNFGWPNVEGFCDFSGEISFCQANNVTEPIRVWTPTLAVAGLDYYNHEAIPEWGNSLLLVNLKERDLRVLKLNSTGTTIESEEVFLNNQYGRLRDLCVSPEGKIYVATSNRDGRGSPATDDDKIIELANLDHVAGIENENELVEGLAFPNPFSTTFKLNESGTYTITNLFGKLIESGNCSRICNLGQNLEKGLYYLSVEGKEGAFDTKLVKN